MNQSEFIQLLDNPARTNPVQTLELKGITEQFPYFQTGRLLYLKGLHNQKSLSFDSQLKTTAIYCNDREVLYYLILQKEVSNKIEAIENEDELELTELKTPISEEKVLNSELKVPKEKEKDEKKEKKSTVKELEQQIIEEAVSASISMEVDSILEEEGEKEPLISIPTELVEEEGSSPVANEAKSFFDWLADKSDEKTTKQEALQELSREKNMENLIDSFIALQPRIPKSKQEFFSPTNIARLSIVDKEDFVTETLANIYVKQGNYEKAINAFSKLSLNYPEKSTYFADRIKSIKKLIKNK